MGSADMEQDETVRIRRFMELDKSTLPADGGPGFNRLIFANSPYLLQHADNPVDWYEWGEAAFARAKAEEKPIFLSIGYATCHWCHVMEHESFEDPAVGEVLNRHFVAIKVDREERPDIDSQYMAVAQMMTGSGGWPLQILMTPERKPFYAVTYLPRQSRMGIPGIITVLEKLAELWRSERSMLEQHTEQVLEALAGMKTPALAALPGEEVLRAAGQQLEQMFDPVYGGFGEAPKFPMPLYLTFLLRYWRRTGKAAALKMAEQTLTMMRQGGIYDQLGFGFHRYATDRQWQVPHFEKMLYDQAQLAVAYLQTCQITGETQYCMVAEEIFSYVLRELTAPDGGFCAGQDADTEGVEGKYYVWTLHEVNRLLGVETAPFFCRLFDVTAAGNFEGENILHRRESLAQFAGREGVTPELLQAKLTRAIAVLLAARGKRIRPFRDEKVLTAWNGLMIGALAKGYGVTGEKRYLAAAEGCAAFIKERLLDSSGRLMRSYHLGEAVIPGFLEDYAFFVEGLIELYEVTLAKTHLADALTLTLEMLRLFRDPDAGGFFDSGTDAEQLLVKAKGYHDGVIPSGNGVAAMNLLRLGSITGDDALRREGEKVIQAFMGGVVQQPAAYLQLLTAYDFYLDPATELTLVGPQDAEELQRMLLVVKKRFIPQLVIRHAQEGDSFRMLTGKPTAYLCAKGACRPPVTTAEDLEGLLDEVWR